MTREVIQSDAIVLTSAEVNAHKILHVLTADRGRIPVKASHARRSTKRFGTALEPLTLIEAGITVESDREVCRLNFAHTKMPFSTLKSDVCHFAIGSLMVEIVTHLVPPHGFEPGVFELLGRALARMDAGKDQPDDLLTLFELRMLQLSGVVPRIKHLEGISTETMEALDGWLHGTWRPLEIGAHARVQVILERQLMELTGRPLRSRPVLDALRSTVP